MYTDAIVIIKAFFDMCLLRRQPQDIPASRELLVFTVGIYLLITFLVVELDQMVTDTILAGLIDTGFLLAFVYLLLFLCRKASRWTQTVTALAGTGIIFSVLVIPIIIGTFDSDPMTPVQQIFYLFQYIILIWYVVVLAHIFRHAISSSFVTGMFISIIYVLSSLILIEFAIVNPVS